MELHQYSHDAAARPGDSQNEDFNAIHIVITHGELPLHRVPSVCDIYSRDTHNLPKSLGNFVTCRQKTTARCYRPGR
ncbi:hypothetical protein GGD50_003059 [Rhizobium paranaense]|uniref:Uncharacterized protein n=1 Tax=Rhizobium paranaense TaxID=1650438 RepID=A0A7W8XRV4_9HYPH|nr:hypothetical protein [Rhizobium paranaense]